MRRIGLASLVLVVAACENGPLTEVETEPQVSFGTVPQVTFRATVLPSLAGRSEAAMDVNVLGHAAGYALDAYGSPHIVMWDEAGIHDLGAGGGAQAINASSQIVGSGRFWGHAQTEGFIWTGGALKDLGHLTPGGYVYALDINDRGQVVGYALSPEGHAHAFRWQDGIMHDLGTLGPGEASEAYGINGDGWVVGWSTYQGEIHAVMWNAAGDIRDLGTLNGGRTSAHAINRMRVVVGVAHSGSSSVFRPFRWTGGSGMAELPSLTAAGALATDLNDFAWVAGHAYAETGKLHAVVWDEQGTPHDLGVPDLGSKGKPSDVAGSSMAYGINNYGQVVGSAHDGQSTRAVLWELTFDPVKRGDCLHGGWEDYGFKNQGQCLRLLETGQDSR